MEKAVRSTTYTWNRTLARTYRLHLEVDERGEVDASRLPVDGERNPEVGALTVADDVLRIVVEQRNEVSGKRHNCE